MRKAEFKWGALSDKQIRVLTWWTDGSKYADYNGIVADGSIRSGKTTSMGFSFIVWAMATFDRQNFAMCGKTIESLRRNVIDILKRQLRGQGYSIQERKSENLIIISKGKHTNQFYLFGGKDERSQDLIQGITLAGAFFDEVALMPESFVNQATGRCSVDGSKWWFNCNPASPQHWFYTKWILKCRSRKLMYLHFTMRDNLTLSDEIIARYEAQYVGVFYQRFIQGIWVTAEGIIFDMFDKLKHCFTDADVPDTEGDLFVSSDYGIQNATVFLLWQKEKESKPSGDAYACIDEYRWSGREEKRQKTVTELVDGLENELLKGKMPRLIYLDPSATALKVELRKRGYKVQSADNDVLDGISDVSVMLKDDRLHFNSDRCKGTIKEFGLYRWDMKAADSGIDRPIKTDDHGMDAVRYFVRTKKLVKRKNPAEISSAGLSLL